MSAAVSSEPIITIEGLDLVIGGQRILDGIQFTVQRGDFVAVVGPSGSGKSTMLRMLGDLMHPSGGEVRIDGRKPEEAWSHLGYVFQSARLVPWRDAIGNVLLGMELRHPTWTRDQMLKQARHYLEMVGLGADTHKLPAQLSGGEKQRVSIARALAVDPDVILLDEPFSALDLRTRRQLQALVTDLWQRTGKTVILVTHDLAEAVEMSNEVIVFSSKPTRVGGRIRITEPRPRHVDDQPKLQEIKAQIAAMIQGRA